MDFYEQIKRGIKLFSFTYIDWLTKFELFSTSSFFFFITFFLRLHPLFVYMSISYVVPIQHKSLFFLLKFTIFYFFLVLYCILFSNTHIDNSVSNKYNSIVDKWIYFSPCHRFDWFHSRNGFIGFSVIQEVFFCMIQFVLPFQIQCCDYAVQFNLFIYFIGILIVSTHSNSFIRVANSTVEYSAFKCG